MKLAIIIPAYNEASVITKVIAGIPKKIAGVSQTSVFVIDDGSDDNTQDFLKCYQICGDNECKNGFECEISSGIDFPHSVSSFAFRATLAFARKNSPS